MRHDRLFALFVAVACMALAIFAVPANGRLVLLLVVLAGAGFAGLRLRQKRRTPSVPIPFPKDPA